MSALEQAFLGGPAIEVVAKATRRRFTVEYKRKIVREADACKTPGTVGALLRREGLYSSHLTTWRARRARGGGFVLLPSADGGRGAGAGGAGRGADEARPRATGRRSPRQEARRASAGD